MFVSSPATVTIFKPASSASAMSSVTSSAGMVAMRLQNLRQSEIPAAFARDSRLSRGTVIQLPSSALRRNVSATRAAGRPHRRRPQAPRSRVDHARETSGRAASWISTKSGCHVPAPPARSLHRIPAASRRRGPERAGSRPASASRHSSLLSRSDHDLDVTRHGREGLDRPAQHRLARQRMHIVWACRRPGALTPCRRQQSGRRCGAWCSPWKIRWNA